MRGTIMDYPLTLPTILEHAGRLHGAQEIVSRRPDRSVHRCTFADFYKRTRLLAEALLKAGLQAGDRVGTLCWNNATHLEAYFGVPQDSEWAIEQGMPCPDSVLFLQTRAEVIAEQKKPVDQVLDQMLKGFGR